MRRDGERKEEVLATSFLRALVLAPVLLGVKEVVMLGSILGGPLKELQ